MKKALVLSGGGSLGAYEIGAWRYFREKGITFDIVTGTSIGAINGAVYICGEFDKALSLWKNITAQQVFENGFNITSQPVKSFLSLGANELFSFFKSYAKKKGVDISPFKELLSQTVDPQKVKDSPITLGIVTTTFKKRLEKDLILQEQPVDKIIDWLHASSACWPMFPVYYIDKVGYIDGGYTNNLPIDFAFKLGADEITAVVLKAVPKEPQHPELLTLPNVRTVRASHDTGFIMDFHPHMIEQNMALGYIDAKRAYGDAWGYEFIFEKDDTTEAKAKEVVTNALKVEPRDIEMFRHGLTYGGHKPQTYLDFYLRGIEVMGSWLKLDFLRCRGVHEFEAEIREKIREYLDNPKHIAHLPAVLSSAKKFRDLDKKAFLAIMYLQTKEGEFSPEMKEWFQERPHLRMLIEIFRYWNEKGLII